ncbi:ferrous iron transport protein B [Polluticaenibacter yanchengensis]|uniref:Ferrous iron transport protein B n=1 Tax=Polluticaenibacter yanchengensis TaxID=3014562 RepID=A0ABT4UMI3_9BACT|nr:ferrous iron transport protein B [Chitinophagaceae bacterium LY-5]
MSKNNIQIALVGNPNSGKTSLFNSLTGLRQQVGNFPGVTVDKKTGIAELNETSQATFIDLPGTYSLYPKRPDEWVSYKVLIGQDKTVKPDLVVLVADASNLKRNLLFCSQIIDLNVPVVMALTMMDLAKQKRTVIDIPGLERELGIPIVPVNPRKNTGIKELKKSIELVVKNKGVAIRPVLDMQELAAAPVNELKHLVPNISDYGAVHSLINYESFNYTAQVKDDIEQIVQKHHFNATKIQAEEITERFRRIKKIMDATVVQDNPLRKTIITEKLDKVLLHRKWGYVIMLAVMLLLFQSIFWLASFPMDLIDGAFGNFTEYLSKTLPEAWWSDLLVNGVVAGIGGVVIFVPQIMILFALVTLLEDSGYMARISFLSDRLMRKAGLNGKSVMPLISGMACAIPAVMSARSIENRKERLLTILITPLMSCSARLPVYVIMISLVVPDKRILGFIGLQGLVMMGLYLFSFVIAFAVAYVAKGLLKIKEKSFFILELPDYREPRWSNVFYTMWEKAKIFVVDAGKIIIVISIILWFAQSHGPSGRLEPLEANYTAAMEAAQSDEAKETLTFQYENDKLANSYAGIVGKSIEPAIAPLGYDWKIGIALITSFAAREVFVGTMGTLYSSGGDVDENDAGLKEKMHNAVREDGTKVYTLATGVSIMLFYLLAMQCMSTLAIVKRETKSWKWPVIQTVYMTGLAYIFSFIAYQLLK